MGGRKEEGSEKVNNLGEKNRKRPLSARITAFTSKRLDLSKDSLVASVCD